MRNPRPCAKSFWVSGSQPRRLRSARPDGAWTFLLCPSTIRWVRSSPTRARQRKMHGLMRERAANDASRGETLRCRANSRTRLPSESTTLLAFPRRSVFHQSVHSFAGHQREWPRAVTPAGGGSSCAARIVDSPLFLPDPRAPSGLKSVIHVFSGAPGRALLPALLHVAAYRAGRNSRSPSAALNCAGASSK